jgi:hypothetical protein
VSHLGEYEFFYTNGDDGVWLQHIKGCRWEANLGFFPSAQSALGAIEGHHGAAHASPVDERKVWAAARALCESRYLGAVKWESLRPHQMEEFRQDAYAALLAAAAVVCP